MERLGRDGILVVTGVLAMVNTSPLLRAALFYARLGIHVFPVAPRSKEPLLRGGRGYHDASVDLERIRGWWRDAPMANIGIACASSHLVVIDVDTYRGGDDALADFEGKYGRTTRTWEALARGRHLYFRAPTEAKFRGHLLGADCGVEVKHHGYVVAPPSVHPSGITYRWDAGWHPTEAPVAEIPPSWLRALGSGRRRTPCAAAVGPARETFVGAAFATCGWLGPDLASGAVCAACPWAEQHSDGRGRGDDSSTVILPPTSAIRVGTFFCSHAHCTHRRTVDAVARLPRRALDAARRRFPREFGALVYRKTVSAEHSA